MISNGHLSVTGLFGHPVGHSRSPQMHNAAFSALGLPYVYHAFDILPERLENAVDSIRTLGIRGVNVTIPHKVEVMEYLDHITPEAEMIGAVNTILNQNGSLIGHNTDGKGYVRSLIEETNISLGATQAVILGAGGAARAVATALALEGTRQIFIANRSVDKGKMLAQRISKIRPAEYMPFEEIPDIIAQAGLIVNTTSLGMHPNMQDTPLDAALLREGQIVSDLIYNPMETRLMREARQKGAIPHSGLGMFVYQGAEAFTLWTGLKAPIQIMRQTLEDIV